MDKKVFGLKCIKIERKNIAFKMKSMSYTSTGLNTGTLGVQETDVISCSNSCVDFLSVFLNDFIGEVVIPTKHVMKDDDSIMFSEQSAQNYRGKQSCH